MKSPIEVRRVLIPVLVAGLAAAAHAQSTTPTWVYALKESGEIVVVNAKTRVVEKTIRLSHAAPDVLYPTPGGKFVLVTHRGTAVISAVDVGLHAETRSFVLSTGRAATLTYSPMGDTVLTTQAGSSRIELWAHRRSVLDHKGSVTAGAADTGALFNRRTTRLYRSSTAGLDFVYLKTGEVINTVPLNAGRVAWVFTPDFRELWGASLDADAVVVVDEARARLVETVRIPHRPHDPVFSEDGERVYLIDPTGRSVVAVDTRTRKVAGKIELASAATWIAASPNGELWAGDPAGVLYVADARRLAVVARLDVGGPVRQMSVVEFREGEGYACF